MNIADKNSPLGVRGYTFNTSHKKIISDMLTPVSIYLRLRAKFKNCILLESSDYHGDEHNFSYICFQPIAGFKVEGDNFIANYPDNSENKISLNENKLTDCINNYIQQLSNSTIQQLFLRN